MKSWLEKIVVMIVNVVELGLAMTLQAIHQTPLLKVIKIEKIVSKKEKDKLEKVSQTFGRVQWTVEEFGEKLELSVSGLDI
jgi:hypothetical protein